MEPDFNELKTFLTSETSCEDIAEMLDEVLHGYTMHSLDPNGPAPDDKTRRYCYDLRQLRNIIYKISIQKGFESAIPTNNNINYACTTRQAATDFRE